MPKNPGNDANLPSGAGFERVGGTISCVLTRFHLRSFLSLPLFFLTFRRVRREARETIPGLIEAVFLIEGPRTCYTLSLWTAEHAILDFGTRVRSHVAAANWSFGHIFFNPDLRRAALWSTQWRLWAVSNNLNWQGVDLRSILQAQQAASTRDGPGVSQRDQANVTQR